jgi:phosphatidylglycerol:prolipoprotein diacylglycerol transferase
MLPVLQIGPFAIQTPLLLLLLGLWFSMSFGSRYSEVFKINSKSLDDLILYSILAGLVGGRLFYIVRFPTAFLENPTSILSLNPELFLAPGALLVGAVAFLVILQRKEMKLWQTLDALTLPTTFFLIFLGLSHLASGKVYGLPTNLPWAIQLWGADRHPTQVYEILGSGIVLGLTWYRFQSTIKTDSIQQSHGKFFLYFLAWISLSWILIEPLRADSVFIAGNLRLIQVIAFVFLVFSFWFQRQINKLS